MIVDKIRKLIHFGKMMEINLADDNVKSCIVAVSMNENIHDNQLGAALMSAYRTQSSLFISALSSTSEFNMVLDILNGEVGDFIKNSKAEY
ncbi:hypothetical protein [Photobacterium sanguinicancri]|uniref:Uncharacterized protein n=1 Tax=Photobacterium sanguinicancri TaxID=875932 RepID=A0AAW7Y629_9GAMM|nr:hypothetical protein [Photobacterium sanguinicancri]MDO6542939.1 hypothetical protein [Photobacterium sanguinicancri]